MDDKTKAIWDQAYEAGAIATQAEIAKALKGVANWSLRNEDGEGDPTDGYLAACLIEMADTIERTPLVMINGALHKMKPRPREPGEVPQR